MLAGVLHINGEPVKRRRIEDYVLHDRFGGTVRMPQYIETLPNGVSHRIIEASGDFGSLDNTPVYVVPPTHSFAMGDNRANSSDSRVTLQENGEASVGERVGKNGKRKE